MMSCKKTLLSWCKPLLVSAVVLLAACNPIAIISADPSPATVGESVTFDGSGTVISKTPADTVATSYEWDFGDGSSAKGEAVSHTYTAVGTYTVTLTVTDSAGREGSTTEEITVEPASQTSTSTQSTTTSGTE
jgi:PKD repeat protein